MLKKLLLGLVITIAALVSAVYLFPEKALTLAIDSERGRSALKIGRASCRERVKNAV